MKPCVHIELHHIILILTILITLGIQTMNIDAPLEGYHNWKSTHYTLQAKNIYEEGPFAHGPFTARSYQEPENNYTGVTQDTLPLYSLITAAGFLLTGVNIITARIIDITMNLLCIILLYHIVLQAKKNKDIALLTSFTYALLPITLYFTQNMQNLSTSMFLMLLGTYTLQRWMNTRKPVYHIITILCYTLGYLTYYTMIFTPVILIILLDQYKPLIHVVKEEYRKHVTRYIPITLIIPLTGLLHHYYNTLLPATHDTSIDPTYLLRPEWYHRVITFQTENHGYIGLILVALTIYFHNRNNKITRRHILLITLITLFTIVMSRKLWYHSYHWMPLIPFTAYLAATTIYHIIQGSHRRYQGLITITIAFTLAVSSLFVIIPLYEYTPGGGNEEAGEYITSHGDGSILHSGGQSYGVLWHTTTSEGCTLPRELHDVYHAEESVNASWILLYDWHRNRVSPGVLDYINTSYMSVLQGDNWVLYQRDS